MTALIRVTIPKDEYMQLQAAYAERDELRTEVTALRAELAVAQQMLSLNHERTELAENRFNRILQAFAEERKHREHRDLVERLFIDGVAYSRDRRDHGWDWDTIEKIADGAVRAARELERALKADRKAREDAGEET